MPLSLFWCPGSSCISINLCRRRAPERANIWFSEAGENLTTSDPPADVQAKMRVAEDSNQIGLALGEHDIARNNKSATLKELERGSFID